MKRIAYICMTLAALCIFSACGKGEDQAQESVVKKTAEQYEGFRLEENSVSDANSFEQDGVSASVTGISYEEVVTKINLHIKNDTEENLRVMSANVSVNGMMTTDYLDCEMPAKSEKDGAIEISNEWFGEMGIAQITDVEFVLKTYNSLNDEIMQSDVIRVKTDAPWSYRQKYDDSGFEIYNAGGMKLSARSLQKSKLSNDTEIVFYAENNTDSTVSIMSQNVAVNGTEIEPLFVITVGAGKKAVDTMVFYEADLTEKQITDIKEVSASFKAFNEELETVFETELLNVPIG